MIKVFLITTEWPTHQKPNSVPFLEQHVRYLVSHGVDVQVFCFSGKGNLINYFKAWLQIRKTSFWHEADILHAHWGQSAFPAIFSKKPLVITYHGSDLQGIVDQNYKYSLSGKVLVLFSKIISLKADCCIVVSEHLKHLLPQHIENVYTIPVGINLHRFRPMDKTACREHLNLDLKKKYVLFVSNPERNEKRFWLAQQAFEIYKQRNPGQDAELLVVNQINYEEVPFYLNAGDVLLITSLHEGSPTVVKEALACNLPIVSVNVGDVEERIKFIDGCFICNNDHPSVIADALSAAIEGNQRINGREFVLNLDEKLLSQKVVSIYKELLN